MDIRVIKEALGSAASFFQGGQECTSFRKVPMRTSWYPSSLFLTTSKPKFTFAIARKRMISSHWHLTRKTRCRQPLSRFISKNTVLLYVFLYNSL